MELKTTKKRLMKSTVVCPVVFITAYDEYALRAFEVNGVDYLLKPLEADKLEKSIRRAMALRGIGGSDSLMQLIKSMQIKTPIYRTRFLVAYRDRYLSLMAEDAAYFTSENRVTYLITHDSKRYVIDQTLDVLESELDPGVFFRVSRQFIVSFRSIHMIYQTFNSQLKIELAPALHAPITLSREKSGQLKKWSDQSSGR